MNIRGAPWCPPPPRARARMTRPRSSRQVWEGCSEVASKVFGSPQRRETCTTSRIVRHARGVCPVRSPAGEPHACARVSWRVSWRVSRGVSLATWRCISVRSSEAPAAGGSGAATEQHGRKSSEGRQHEPSGRRRCLDGVDPPSIKRGALAVLKASDARPTPPPRAAARAHTIFVLALPNTLRGPKMWSTYEKVPLTAARRSARRRRSAASAARST